MDDEWRTRVDCIQTGCLRAPLLSNTETIKKGSTYQCLSSETTGLVKGISIPIGQNHRFRLSAPISYRPNSTVLKMSIDAYLVYQSVQIKEVQ